MRESGAHVATGRTAETVAAKFLQAKGYEIMAQNWRTRWCEIDIVARKGGTIFFCEVKYRVSGRQGGGLDYITAKKQGQMLFAAELWAAGHGWSGDCQLCAVEVSGPGFAVTAAVLL